MFTYLLLGLLVLFLALFFVPLTFRGQGRLAASISGEIELVWAGGLVQARWLLNQSENTRSVMRLGRWVTTRKELQTGSRRSGSAKFSDPDSKTQPPRNSPDQRQSRWNNIKPLLNRDVIKESLLFLGQIWNSLKLHADLAGEYGTDDPALTGVLAGLVACLTAHQPGLCFYPRFDGARLDLNGELNGRIIPALLIWELGRFLTRAPIRKIWWPKLSEKVNKNRRRSVYV